MQVLTENGLIARLMFSFVMKPGEIVSTKRKLLVNISVFWM